MNTFTSRQGFSGFAGGLLKAAIAVSACLAAFGASAQVCCPAGCVQDSNHCVFNGTQQACAPTACPNPSNGGGGGSQNGGGRRYVVPPQPFPINGRTCAVDQPPRGSYRQTCERVSWDCKTLSAVCRTRQGTLAVTSMQDTGRCIGDLANMDGQLHCSKDASPPGGSYMESCRDIWVEQGTLHAECRHSDGRWTQSPPLGYGACHNGIENIEGTLKCK